MYIILSGWSFLYTDISLIGIIYLVYLYFFLEDFVHQQFKYIRKHFLNVVVIMENFARIFIQMFFIENSSWRDFDDILLVIGRGFLTGDNNLRKHFSRWMVVFLFLSFYSILLKFFALLSSLFLFFFFSLLCYIFKKIWFQCFLFFTIFMCFLLVFL